MPRRMRALLSSVDMENAPFFSSLMMLLSREADNCVHSEDDAGLYFSATNCSHVDAQVHANSSVGRSLNCWHFSLQSMIWEIYETWQSLREVSKEISTCMW